MMRMLSTVEEIIERYNKKFRPTVHAKLVASASSASASAAGPSSDTLPVAQYTLGAALRTQRFEVCQDS